MMLCQAGGSSTCLGLDGRSLGRVCLLFDRSPAGSVIGEKGRKGLTPRIAFLVAIDSLRIFARVDQG